MKTRVFTIESEEGPIEFKCRKITMGALRRRESLRKMFGMDDKAMERARDKAFAQSDLGEDTTDLPAEDAATAVDLKTDAPEMLQFVSDLLIESCIDPVIDEDLDLEPLVAANLFNELLDWNVKGKVSAEAARFRGEPDRVADGDSGKADGGALGDAVSVPVDSDAG